jgi:hypothetical protein
MSTIEQSVEVEAPLSTAYTQWTQLAETGTWRGKVKRPDEA